MSGHARDAWRSGPVQALLGSRLPLVQGPFGGGLSSVLLAGEVTRAGGVGSYGAHIVPPDSMPDLVADLRAATAGGPFTVNLWVPQDGEAQARLGAAEYSRAVALLRPYLDELGLPDPPNPEPDALDFHAQLEALLAAAPPAVSFVMGVPPAAALAEARERGIVTIGTATTVDEAVALADAGVDAVVASGSDAGGHRGAFLRPVEESLVGTFSLIPQVADAVGLPVIAAGGIADPRGVAAALMLGADGVQIGTAFLATEESGASPVHRAALHGPDARTTVLTRVFSGRLARGIPNRFVREVTPMEPAVPPYPLQNALTAALRAEANRRGRGDLVHLWAGQAASLTAARPAGDLVHELAVGVADLLGAVVPATP